MEQAPKAAKKPGRKAAEVNAATDWFEPLYRRAGGNAQQVPWARSAPHPELVDWYETDAVPQEGSKTLVIGCGLGDDAEFLAAQGLRVTAFDLSETAIQWCRERFPDSTVSYVVADLFDPPEEWIEHFDFVCEAYTIQSLPLNLRPQAIEACVRFLAPAGQILVIAVGRPEDETDPDGPPWPLSREEFHKFIRLGLIELSFKIHPTTQGSVDRYFRGLYKRPHVSSRKGLL